jgi:hypothetical protein
MVSEGRAGQSGQQDAQKAGGSSQPSTEPKNQIVPATKKPGHQTKASPTRHPSDLQPHTRQPDAKQDYQTAIPTPKNPIARSAPMTTQAPAQNTPWLTKVECHCPVIVTVIVLTLLCYAIAGGLGRKWVTRDRSWKKLAVAASLALLFLLLSYGIRQWPFYLAAELSVVLLGLTAGWCWIDYDRRKINGPGLSMDSDLDQLGYFNSRVAMRSADLFNVTVLDIPVGSGEQPQRDIAHLLVQRYWGISLKIINCIATPNDVTVYFSQPADEAGAPDKSNYVLEQEKEPAKEPEGGKAKDANVGGETQSNQKESKGKKTDSKKEYEIVGIESAASGLPNRHVVVLSLKSQLPVGTQLRLTVNNLRFRAPANDPEGELLLPPNNTYSFKVTDKSSPDVGGSLKKVLQPAYAIGIGIITGDQYNTLKNEFFAQSELSLGLIVPLILVVLGLALIPQIGLGPAAAGGELSLHSLAWFFVCASLAPISMGLFLVGAERFHKFRMEVKLLILGNWQKQKDAAKQQHKKDKDKAKKDKGAKDKGASKIQKALAEAIKNARVPELKVNLDATTPDDKS